MGPLRHVVDDCLHPVPLLLLFDHRQTLLFVGKLVLRLPPYSVLSRDAIDFGQQRKKGVLASKVNMRRQFVSEHAGFYLVSKTLQTVFC